MGVALTELDLLLDSYPTFVDDSPGSHTGVHAWSIPFEPAYITTAVHQLFDVIRERRIHRFVKLPMLRGCTGVVCYTDRICLRVTLQYFIVDDKEHFNLDIAGY